MSLITVLGEVVIDRFIKDGQVTDIAGGSAANCALALTKIEDEVKFRARFSNDSAGDFLYQTALTNKLDITQSIRATQPATVVEIVLSATGVPNYTFHMNNTADWAWTRAELELFPIENSEALVFGSLAAVLQPSYSVLKNWISSAKEMGVLIAYDPNARPSAVNPNEADHIRDRIETLVKIANVVKVSDEDLAWIKPDESPEQAAITWSQVGPDLVVLTRGEHGAAAFRRGLQIANVPGVKTNVVDTVGAGDTLMAWLVSGLLGIESEMRFNAASVESVVHRAVKAAAITCSRAGCQPPTHADLKD